MKEGARPHPQHHHPVSQGHPFSTMCWLVTESPPEVHKLSQIQNAHTPSRRFHHTIHTITQLISCVGRATTPHNHIHFAPSLPFLWPYCPHNHTGVVCYHGHPHLARIKCHTGWGTWPPITTSQTWAPQVKHRPAMSRPNGSSKNCFNAHTLHTAVGTHPQA